MIKVLFSQLGSSEWSKGSSLRNKERARPKSCRYTLVLLAAFFLLIPAKSRAAYYYKQLFSGTEGTKMNIIWIPSGYPSTQSSDFIDRVSHYMNKMWEVNWFADHKEYFNVYYITGDDGKEPVKVWDEDGQPKTPDEMAVLLSRLPNGWGKSNFINDRTFKNFPSVLINYDPIAGGATAGYFYIGRTAGDYEYPHEYAHDGFAYVLCDEYDMPAKDCRGSDRCRNLDDQPSNRKWSEYIQSDPFEGAGHCASGIWRPTQDSILRSPGSNPEFGPLAYHAMDLGFQKRYGITEYTSPSITCDLRGGSTVSGKITIHCQAADASGIEMVEFFLAKAGEKHRSLDIIRTPPYEVDLDTSLLQDGQYYLRAIAWDNNWNWAQYNPQFTIANRDDTRPSVSAVRAIGNASQVLVFFNEPVDGATATMVSNYAIDNSVDVRSVSLTPDFRSASLTTTALSPNVNYTLSISNIRDRSSQGNSMLATQLPFRLLPEVILDNLNVSSGNAYVVTRNALQVGQYSYVDRSYTFTVIPPALTGLTYIKTAGNDNASEGQEFLRFRIDRPATVFVAHSDLLPSPEWLKSFSDTGYHVTLSTGAVLNVFYRAYSPGNVVLGGNYGAGKSMYVVFLQTIPPPMPPTKLRVVNQ